MSFEQRRALFVLEYTEKNLIINACAGSGKTTTVFQLAKSLPHLKFLVFVFNRLLMDETIAKAHQQGLTNIEVFTYHAFGYKFYTSDCVSNEGLKRTVRENLQVIGSEAIPEADIIILDEHQDMTPTMHEFAKKVYRDSKGYHGKQKIRLCLLGDPIQEIYGYLNADYRFLTLADHVELYGDLVGGGGEEYWEKITKYTSYRMTKETVKFINEQVIKASTPEEELKSISTGPKPKYIICDALNYEKKRDILKTENRHCLLEEVERQRKMYGPDQILISCPSLRMSEIRSFANALSLAGHKIEVSHDRGIPKSVRDGKNLVSNFHRVKGMERLATFVINFDSSYTRCFKTQVPIKATNDLFVGVTRGKQQLTLVHHYKNDYLSFIDKNTLGDSCDIIKTRPLHKNARLCWAPDPEDITESDNSSKSIERLCHNLPVQALADCMQLIKLEEVSPPRPKNRRILVPSITEIGEGLQEYVHDITTKNTSAICESYIRKSSHSFRDVLDYPKKDDPSHFSNETLSMIFRKRELFEMFLSAKQKSEDGSLEISDMLFLGNLANSRKTGFIAKVLNIPQNGYTWIKDEQAKSIARNLTKISGWKDLRFNNSIQHLFEFDDDGTTIRALVTGCPDVWRKTDKGIWAFPESGNSQWAPEDFIKFAIHAAILENVDKETSDTGPKQLVNLWTGQVINVEPIVKDSFQRIAEVVCGVKSRLVGGNPRYYSDEKFLENCKGGFKEYTKELLPSWVNRQG